VVAAAALNHRVPFGDCFAKYAAASLKKIAFLGHVRQLALEAGDLFIPRCAAAGKGLAVSRSGLTDPARQHVRIDADLQGDLATARLRSPNQFDDLPLVLRAVTLALRHGHSFRPV
jgi:hypothetical protein